MGTNRDESSCHHSDTVVIDAIPDPVFGYDIREDDPVVVTTNEAFDDVFETISSGRPVDQWLRSDLATDEASVKRVCSSLVAGRPVDATVGPSPMEVKKGDSERYRFRTFDGTGNRTAVEGYCLLTELAPSDAGGADVGVDRIASAISHDLRNPLDVADAHLQAARETGEDEHFDHVNEAHDRMGRIIRDVLTLARGENALNVTADVDIETVANDAWQTVDTEEATVELDDSLQSVPADPDRLQRLFENLFRNSIEHARRTTANCADETDEPGSDTSSEESLVVRVGRMDSGFFVADNGVGVPTEERDRVFDAGYSTGEAGDGTGLGLTIVEQIARAHDWMVTLTTGPSGGARFEFQTTPDDS